MDLYQHTWNSLTGQPQSMSDYKGKVVMVVNTASKCGLTPQSEALQKIYKDYQVKGLVILGFPCNQFLSQEPGDSDAIASFCSINYGVSFPMAEKIKVNGSDTHPLFKDLKQAAPGALGSKGIKRHFTKFLINKDGTEAKRFAPKDDPNSMRSLIESWLEA